MGGSDSKVHSESDARFKEQYAVLEGKYAELQANHAKLEAKLAAATSEAKPSSEPTMLTFLHINDVYKILPRKKNREPAGGLARMATLIDGHASSDPIITMGGDFMSPSVMSTFTKGAHMIDAMNHIGVKYGILGNHEFDFGMETLEARINGDADLDDDGVSDNAKSATTWLLSNVVDTTTGKPPCGAVESVLFMHQGVKVGMIGLVEDWVSVLGKVPSGRLAHTSQHEVGRRLCAELREQGAQMVVAITHNRIGEDRKLAEACQGIDLILGGHDHFLDSFQVGCVTCAKAGVDFRHLAVIKAAVPSAADTKAGVRAQVQWPIEMTPTAQSVAEQPTAKALCDRYGAVMEKRMGVTIAINGSDAVDTSEALVRVQESSAGNLFTDIFRAQMNADVCFANGGAFRGSKKFAPGPFSRLDVYTIFPFDGQIVKLAVTGEDLWELAENGVSCSPAEDGRFPSVSGMAFGFRPSSPRDARVEWLKVHGKDVPRGSQERFTLATSTYLAAGKEGADCIEDAERLVDDEFGPQTQTCVIDGLKALASAGGGTFTAPPAEGRIANLDDGE